MECKQFPISLIECSIRDEESEIERKKSHKIKMYELLLVVDGIFFYIYKFEAHPFWSHTTIVCKYFFAALFWLCHFFLFSPLIYILYTLNICFCCIECFFFVLIFFLFPIYLLSSSISCRFFRLPFIKVFNVQLYGFNRMKMVVNVDVECLRARTDILPNKIEKKTPRYETTTTHTGWCGK